MTLQSAIPLCPTTTVLFVAMICLLMNTTALAPTAERLLLQKMEEGMMIGWVAILLGTLLSITMTTADSVWQAP